MFIWNLPISFYEISGNVFNLLFSHFFLVLCLRNTLYSVFPSFLPSFFFLPFSFFLCLYILSFFPSYIYLYLYIYDCSTLQKFGNLSEIHSVSGLLILSVRFYFCHFSGEMGHIFSKRHFTSHFPVIQIILEVEPYQSGHQLLSIDSRVPETPSVFVLLL